MTLDTDFMRTFIYVRKISMAFLHQFLTKFAKAQLCYIQICYTPSLDDKYGKYTYKFIYAHK